MTIFYHDLRHGQGLPVPQAYALMINAYNERLTVGTRLCCKMVSQAQDILDQEWLDLKGYKLRPERQGYPMGAVSQSEPEQEVSN
jgi:hypothetical protein